MHSARRRPRRIISGGQTGVDRAALDAALSLGIEHGGWCPRGRRAEDGRIASRYRLRETQSSRYHVRTRANVLDADGTLILTRGPLTGGTGLTQRVAFEQARPCLVVDLDAEPLDPAAVHVWLAAHDIEAAMLGTSLGVDLGRGRSVPHGHTHHLRAINRVRRVGSIEESVRSGLISSGIMRACVLKPIPYVLCGSIRDDGPLPGVITDNVEGQDAMRRHVPGVGVAILCATTLHSVATGNILPATVKTFCVDSDADTVIKLTDRGTHQAVGIVTDVEFFLKELARQLSLA